MSIRLLTAGLGIEAEESRRQQQYDVARMREPQDNPIPPESSFLSGRGKRREKPTPPSTTTASTPPRQVNLKPRTTTNPWGIPGGIAARFGAESLQKQVVNIEPEEIEEQPETSEITAQEPVEETQETEQSTDAAKENTEENTSEQDENARITIELQSSH